MSLHSGDDLDNEQLMRIVQYLSPRVIVFVNVYVWLWGYQCVNNILTSPGVGYVKEYPLGQI